MWPTDGTSDVSLPRLQLQALADDIDEQGDSQVNQRSQGLARAFRGALQITKDHLISYAMRGRLGHRIILGALWTTHTEDPHNAACTSTTLYARCSHAPLLRKRDEPFPDRGSLDKSMARIRCAFFTLDGLKALSFAKANPSMANLLVSPFPRPCERHSSSSHAFSC